MSIFFWVLEETLFEKCIFSKQYYTFHSRLYAYPYYLINVYKIGALYDNSFLHNND